MRPQHDDSSVWQRIKDREIDWLFYLLPLAAAVLFFLLYVRP